MLHWLASHADALSMVDAQNAARLLEAFAEHDKSVRRHVLFVLSAIVTCVLARASVQRHRHRVARGSPPV